MTRESNAYNATLRYKKDRLWLDGLGLNLFASVSRDHYTTADTVLRQYYWDGSWTRKGATEMGGLKTLSHIIRPRKFVRGNLTYAINEQHSLNLNFTTDILKNESYNELLADGDDTPGKMNKQITGLLYQQEFLASRWVNSFFVKHYRLGLARERYRDGAYYLSDTSFSNFGYGLATRYKFSEDLGLKASFEHAYRLQEVEEMFGDGLNVQPNPDLLPERSDNINLGFFYGLNVRSHRFVIEAAGFYRNAADFIYPVPDQRSKALKNENKSNVRITGLEGEIRYLYGDLLSVSLNATYQNAVNTTKFSREDATVPEATYLNKIPNQPWLFGNADLTIGRDNVLGKNSRLQFNWFTQYVHWFYLTGRPSETQTGNPIFPTSLFTMLPSRIHSAMDATIFRPNAEILPTGVPLTISGFKSPEGPFS